MSEHAIERIIKDHVAWLEIVADTIYDDVHGVGLSLGADEETRKLCLDGHVKQLRAAAEELAADGGRIMRMYRELAESRFDVNVKIVEGFTPLHERS